MKSNGFFRLMENPFTRIAGWQAFGLGLVFLVVSGIIGGFGSVVFDGVIDSHLVKQLTMMQSFSYIGISLLTLVLVMWMAGLFIAKGFRFIDILGTMTLSKAPFLLIAIVGYFAKMPDMNEVMKNPMVVFHSVSMVMLMILSIPVVVWSITLIYNALKISSGASGGKLTTVFIIAILASEAISKLMIYFLM